MEIRRASVSDAAEIAAVHVRTWQAAYQNVFGTERLAGLDTPRRIAGWTRALEEGESIFVADDDGSVVGFVALGACEVRAIYALPEAWGSGAGPDLMRAAIAQLRDDGCVEAFLWVLEDNPRARRFYEREGWSLDGGRREGEHLGLETAEMRYRIEL